MAAAHFLLVSEFVHDILGLSVLVYEKRDR